MSSFSNEYQRQRIMDELVSFWQTCYEPRNLITHLDVSHEADIVRSFLMQVYNDLRAGKRDKYTAFSASEFKSFLETEYSQLVQKAAELEAQAEAKREAERQAQDKAKAKEREESERKARFAFEALGKKMARTTIRSELVELGQKRADLAPYTGVSYIYKNHCWQCKGPISSAIHAQCPDCRFYICYCGACLCGRPTETYEECGSF